MFLSTSKSGRRSSLKHSRNRDLRPFRASVEAVEGRLLMASLSAVSFMSGGVHHNEVFSLGADGQTYAQKDGGTIVDLGGFSQQVSAGLSSAGNPVVYAIGSGNTVYSNNNNDGGGWHNFGGPMNALSATNDGHVYGIYTNGSVWESSGGAWTSLGGVVKQISAGVDWSGKPEVFAIGTDNNVYVNDGKGFTGIGGGPVTAISATSDNSVYAMISGSNAVEADYGGGWNALGGTVKQISAGTDAAGYPEVYGIGTNNALYVNDGISPGWVGRGGYFMEVSGVAGNMAFGRGGDVSQIFLDCPSGYTYWGDLPLAEPGAATAYSNSTAPLYSSSGQPSYLDVQQGQVGDCWLEASMAEVAARAPQDIKNMITYDGIGKAADGTSVSYYSVRLYSPNGSAFSVEVDTEFPSGGQEYNHVTNALGTKVLWASLIEKAYAEANEYGYVTTSLEDNGTYASLSGGWPAWALQAITGNSASGVAINPTNIGTAWNNGQLVVLCTSTPTSSLIVGSHCYAVVGYNASAGNPYEIFNAWGTDSSGWAPGNSGTKYGLFNANAAFVSQNFTLQTTAYGATKGATGTSLLGLTDETGDGKVERRSITVSTLVKLETPTGNSRPATEIAKGQGLNPEIEGTTISLSFHAPKKTIVIGSFAPKASRML